ncbi:hypothetical protein BX600DRAFT_508291 [Xylariales sp. PMI_506]|nr:hypothetical protein BX600DRAFT_508291 [Xylariales sp. PMI_506]
MHFTTAALTTLFASAVFAAPAEQVEPRKNWARWTIECLSRTCDEHDTVCTWDFTIDTHGRHEPTACSFSVYGHPASETDLTDAACCGDFSVTTGWSGQFGEGNGFTTLAVVNNDNSKIIWPAYTDVQLEGGQVVVPDQSYHPTRP